MWVRMHTNKRPRRARGVETALSFYEAAALWPPLPDIDPPTQK